MITLTRYYIGLNGRTDEQDIAFVEGVLLREYQGFTRIAASGGWINDRGEPERQAAMVFDAIDFYGTAKPVTIAAQLTADLKRDSIMWTRQPIEGGS